MDPISILGLVGSLVPLCVKITKSLNDIKSKYLQSNATISAITCECSVIATALTHIEKIAKQDPGSLASRLDPSTSQLGSSFELALNGCSITLIVLNDEIQKITGSEKAGFLSWKPRAKYMWNEEAMKDMLTTIRGQQSALHLLVTAVQTESMSDVRRILDDNNALLKQMVQRSQTLRQKRAASTIGGDDKEFDFDDQIVTSTAYRRAFSSFVRRTGPKSKGKDGESAVTPGEFSKVAQGPPRSSWNFSEDDQAMKASVDALAPQFEQTHLDRSQAIPRKPLATTGSSASSDATYDQRVQRLARINPASPKSAASWSELSGPTISQPWLSEEILVPIPKPPRNPESDPLLRTAAEKGHTALVRMLLLKGADVNSSDASSLTPLLLAVQNGHVETVRAILEAGPDLKHKNTVGNTALHIACLCNGQVPIVSALLDAGMDIEVPGYLGWHPLHHAAANDMVMIVDLLVHRGGQLESCAENGDRPLHVATEFGKQQGALRLIELGADIEAPNSGGNRPLNIAAMKNQLEVAKLLVQKGAAIEGVGAWNWHPLHHAAANGSVATLEFLIENGADLDALAHLGARPIHMAASFPQHDPNASTVAALISHGVDVEVRQSAGTDNQPLHVAAKNGHLAALKLLVAAGSKIHSRGWHGFTPLHEAAAWGQVAVAEWLLQHGADPEYEADHNYRPIHAATHLGNLEVTQVLLKQNVNVNVHCEDRSTPLACAAFRGNVDVMKALINHGAKTDSIGKSGGQPIHDAVCGGHLSGVRFLVELGVDLECRNDGGDTPLIEAVRHGHLATVRALIEAGAKIEGTGWSDWHPLHHAASNGHEAILKLLIELGADKEAPARRGERPLHLAATNGKVNTVRVLLENGVDIGAVQDDGKTALYQAVENGHLEVAELLV